MPGTDRLMNYEQGQHIVEELHRIAEFNAASYVEIPVLDSIDIQYDGNDHKVEFSNVDNVRVIFSGDLHATNPGFYTVTAYLKSTNDQWTDETRGPKEFKWSIGGGATSWANASDSVIAQLVTSADHGDCNLITDYGWAIGDERVVHISSGGTANFAEQYAVMVLMDTDHYELKEATTSGRTKSQFVVGFKDCIANTGIGNNSQSVWTNTGIYPRLQAIPRDSFSDDFAKIFKPFKVYTSESSSYDLFSLFGINEVDPNQVNQESKVAPSQYEADNTYQIEYFKTDTNRIKLYNAPKEWYLRSYLGSAGVIVAASGLTIGRSGFISDAHGLSPFGVI